MEADQRSYSGKRQRSEQERSEATFSMYGQNYEELRLEAEAEVRRAQAELDRARLNRKSGVTSKARMNDEAFCKLVENGRFLQQRENLEFQVADDPAEWTRAMNRAELTREIRKLRAEEREIDRELEELENQLVELRDKYKQMKLRAKVRKRKK
jgi:hypothetical protein